MGGAVGQQGQRLATGKQRCRVEVRRVGVRRSGVSRSGVRRSGDEREAAEREEPQRGGRRRRLLIACSR